MVGIGPPIPVKQVAVLADLVFLGTDLSRCPVGSADGDRKVEDGGFEDPLLAGQRNSLTFVCEVVELLPGQGPLAVLAESVDVVERQRPYHRVISPHDLRGYSEDRSRRASVYEWVTV